VGLWKDFSQVDKMIQIDHETRPDPRRKRLYDHLYGAFNDVYAALDSAAIFAKLATCEDLSAE
jgi:hypothetical protein